LPAALITGQVFNDSSGDGIRNFAEVPLANVTVVLLDQTNTVVGETTTAVDGSYEFINIPPGSYTLRETDPNGYISTTINIVPISIGYGGTVYVNFGDQQVGTVSGVVFHDYNGNGMQETQENGIQAITVELIDSTGLTVETTTTGSFGSYVFTGVSAGLYTVRETDASGYVSTTSNTVAVSIADSGAETANFGDRQSYAISGTVYEDMNGNGTMDGLEIGIPGVIIKLYDSNNSPVGAAITDAAGTYSFLEIASGSYLVEEADPDGYGSTTTNTVPVSVSSTSVAIANFGDIQDSSISGLVFNDMNGNGIQDAGENPITNVLITLKDGSNTVIGETITDAAGTYLFTGISAGSYTVSETDPPGYFSTTSNTALVNLSDGGTGTANFGDQQAGTVSGIVFNDFNANGIQDPGENGIGGVVIELHDDNGFVLQTVITAGNGSYIFVNVAPGSYTVWETDPEGFESTTNNFVPVSINSNSGASAIFGDKQAGTISGVVFNDINGSGVQDSGEGGLGNVLISLLDSTGTLITTEVSDAAGMYQFNSIETGMYTVQATDPDGYTSTTDNAVTVTLAAGGTGTANFGDKQSGIVSGIVFNDINENGIQDAGEMGISGVTVRLFNPAGSLFQATMTGSNGVYGFTNVEPGMYSVQETDPDGYFSTTGNTATVTLAEGGTGTANFGDKQSGTVSGIVFNDINENGIQDAGEMGISGVTVKLFNPTGSVVQATMTGSNGVYGFTNIEPGMYSVQETDPESYLSTTANTVPLSFTAGAAGSADFGDILETNHPSIYDPPSAWKTIISSEPVIIWEMLWINDSNVDALLVRITDRIPPDTEFAGYVDASGGNAWYDMATDTIFWEGNIPANGQVKIWYSTTVPTDSDFTENQAIGIWDQNGNSDLSDDISASNFPVYTDDPLTRELLDPTQWTREQCTSSIGGTVWLDPCNPEERLILIPKPGFGYIVQKEFEDRITPLDGAIVDLYLDINQDGHYSEGNDTLLMSSGTGMNLTTGQEGYYSFDSLCPGNFTIRVSPYNFESEGILEGYISQDGETDITITLPDADSIIDDVDFFFIKDSSQ
jgi:protocatechuate 3,4-dioxygenase beta subunit